MATTKLTLKLLIDKKANRVLFAEASKDFVDFLFSLLSFPVGSVIKLLTKNKMVGCIGNLYESVENMNDTYILHPNKNKELLLNPKVASAAPLNAPLLTLPDDETPATAFYVCGSPSYNHRGNVTNDPNLTCPSCGSRMSTKINYITSKTSTTTSSIEKGYVKEVVTYMVMDDLTVSPMSTISSITLLKKFNVENVSLLEEKVVDLGMEEGLEILKISLQSKTVLSQVFLAKKAI